MYLFILFIIMCTSVKADIAEYDVATERLTIPVIRVIEPDGKVRIMTDVEDKHVITDDLRATDALCGYGWGPLNPACGYYY